MDGSPIPLCRRALLGLGLAAAPTAAQTLPPYVAVMPGAAVPMSVKPSLGAISPQGRLAVTLPARTVELDSLRPVEAVARRADGRPLPAWLRFDPATGTLAGQPPAGVPGNIAVEFVFRDSDGRMGVTRLDIVLRR